MTRNGFRIAQATCRDHRRIERRPPVIRINVPETRAIRFRIGSRDKDMLVIGKQQRRMGQRDFRCKNRNRGCKNIPILTSGVINSRKLRGFLSKDNINNLYSNSD